MIRDLLKTSRSRVHLGVSVGPRHIRLVQVATGPGGYRVIATSKVDAARKNALRDAVRKMNCEGLPATIAVDDRALTYTSLTLPKLSRRELGRVVEREAGNAAGADHVHAWAPVPGHDGQNVAVRSVPLDTARLWARNLIDAGLAPNDMIPNAAAMAAAMTLPDERATDELLFLLDVRDDRATLVACRAGERVYDRHLAHGWGSEQVPAPVAEPMTEAAPPPDADPTRYSQIELEGEPPAPEAPKPAAARSAGPAPVPPDWARIAEEIQRTHLYCKKNLKTGPLVHAVMAGTGNRRAGLVDWLSEAIQVPVNAWEAHRGDITWPEAPEPAFLRALGAAIAGLEERRFTRLIPAEYTVRKVAPVTARVATAALGVSLAAGLAGVWIETTVLSDQRRNIIQLEKAVKGVRYGTPRAAGDPNDRANLEALRAETDLMRRKDALPFPGEAAIVALGRAMPANAHLYRLKVEWDGTAWHLNARGEVAAGPLPSLVTLGHMVEALGADPLFHSVRFVPDSADADGTPFALDMTLGGPGATHLP